MSDKPLSTFEKEMQNASFREQFEEEYSEFVLAEIIKSLMESSH